MPKGRYWCEDCQEHHPVDAYGDYVCPVDYENCGICGDEIGKDEFKRNDGTCDRCFEKQLTKESENDRAREEKMGIETETGNGKDERAFQNLEHFVRAS